MVNKAVEDLVCSQFGEDRWEAIKEKAGLDIDMFISNESYPDDITCKLVGAATEVLELPADKIHEAFGQHWVLKTAVDGIFCLNALVELSRAAEQHAFDGRRAEAGTLLETIAEDFVKLKPDLEARL
tara:strand:+ start:242 stop:622 length:381 start_codon:yes stop_codon:yes gene_type:complete